MTPTTHRINIDWEFTEDTSRLEVGLTPVPEMKQGTTKGYSVTRTLSTPFISTSLNEVQGLDIHLLVSTFNDEFTEVSDPQKKMWVDGN